MKIRVITSTGTNTCTVEKKPNPTNKSKHKGTCFKVTEEPNLNCLSNCLQSPITTGNKLKFSG